MLSNPLAMNGASVDEPDAGAEYISYPLSVSDIAPVADGAAVVVLASGEVARRLRDDPIWVNGVGWASDSPTLETREWTEANYAKIAAKHAYKRAGIRDPSKDIQLAEIDDTYSYKELQHAEALGLNGTGKVHQLLEQGVFDADGSLPINPSGGSIGMGNTLEMSGLVRTIELAQQLRGQAAAHQIHGVQTGVAQCWRGIPTTTGAVIILSNR